jgi:hypothetical protein
MPGPMGGGWGSTGGESTYTYNYYWHRYPYRQDVASYLPLSYSRQATNSPAIYKGLAQWTGPHSE